MTGWIKAAITGDYSRPDKIADDPKLMSTKDARRLAELTNKENEKHGMKLSRKESAELHAIREHLRKVPGGENAWQQTSIGKIIYYPNPGHGGGTIKHNITTGDKEIY